MSSIDLYSSSDTSLFYSIRPADWYKTFPFIFEISNGTESITAIETVEERPPLIDPSWFPKSQDPNKMGSLFKPRQATVTKSHGTSPQRFFLPIPPQSMSVQFIPTAEATATIGGVVEETSAPVFATITLTGTTGVSITNKGMTRNESGAVIPNVSQRVSYDELTNQGNIISRVGNSVVNVIDEAVNLLALTPEKTLPFSRFGSAVRTPANPQATTGGGDSTIVKNLPLEAKGDPEVGYWQKVGAGALGGFLDSNIPASAFSNGYSWDHALRQFFLIYQRERAKNTQLALYFIDVKSNNRWRCVPRAIQFTKSSSNPYQSNYNIVLKCWNLGEVDESVGRKNPQDRFKGDLREVYTVNALALWRRAQEVGTMMRRLEKSRDFLIEKVVSGAKGSYI